MKLRGTAATLSIVGALAAVIWSTELADPRPALASSAPRVVVEVPAEIVEPPPVEAPAPPPPPRPMRKVPLPRSRITSAISKTARDLLGRPMGSETLRDVDGETYAFTVERHYHAPESGFTPVGWHKGVTVYAFER